MGRANIAECGRRFTSEYQPAGRGRPKGSRNRQTIVRAYFEAQEPRPLEEVIEMLLDEVFGKKRKGRRRGATGDTRIEGEGGDRPAGKL